MANALATVCPEGGGARVEPVRLGVWLGVTGSARWEGREDDLRAGPRRFAEGLIEVEVEREDHGDAATLGLSIRNRSSEPQYVDSLEMRLLYRDHGLRELRFLRNGWQSWSSTGVRDLDESGEEEFPSGPWLRGVYHCMGASRPGWHESETLALVGGTQTGPFCLIGVLETGLCFGVLHLRPGPGGPGGRPVMIDVELRLEIPLAPGERRQLEAIRVAVSPAANPMLERFAELWGSRGGARRDGPFQTGWCSWYHFFHHIDEQSLLRNLDALTQQRDQIPVGVVQLDDGYQRTIGDWLEPSERFPGGIQRIAESIQAAGFSAGIWTAPFAVSEESRVFRAHPKWVLAGETEARLRGSYTPHWSEDGWVYVLDTSRQDVRDHLQALYASLVEIGFSYQKLDFLYMPAMRGRASDPSYTRADRLRAGLSAIRAGVGEETFLLGCGCPLGPGVGWLDGMRIGPDVSPSWDAEPPAPIPGLEDTVPSTRTALRSTFARQFLHRRLWLNDPDCLMVRRRETRLRTEEAESLAAGIALTGAMVVFSDDVPKLGAAECQVIDQVIGVARFLDEASTRGTARAIWPQGADGGAHRMEARGGLQMLRADINLGEEPAEIEAADQRGPVEDLWGGARDENPSGVLLAPHASRVVRYARDLKLAVFCDFDGTFSVQDVGRVLAERHLSDRRAELWRRYIALEIDPWQYAVELFDDFSFSADALDAFLSEIDLDPGASALLDWCTEQKVPFRILSDGFDYNLNRLQEIHGVSFDHTCNRLYFEGTLWRVEAGGRNPACFCGTGLCKRQQIEAYRRIEPAALCVHIGNGRVSDLCGAEAADIVFAKDTLKQALIERGVYFETFETLHHVVSYLERAFGRTGQILRADPDLRG